MRGWYWYFNPITAPFKWASKFYGASAPGSQDIVSKITDPLREMLSQFADAVGDLDFKAIFDNLAAYYGRTGMDDRSREEMDYQLKNQQILNQEAYDRQIEFYENYQSPQALVGQYKAAGLNPMLLAGSQPGASATSPSSGSASGPSGSGGDLLGILEGFLNMSMRQSQFKQNLDMDKLRLGVDKYKAETERLQAEAYREYLGSIVPLNEQTYRWNEERYPRELSQIDANTEYLRELSRTQDSIRRLNEAGISQRLADAALSMRQEALLSIKEKYADQYESAVASYSYYQSQLAKTQSEFERRTLLKRIEIVEKSLENMTLEGVNMVLSNGVKAKEFQTFGQANAREWVRTINGTLTAVGGLMAGGAVAGKAAGILGGMAAPAPTPNLPGTGIQGPGPGYMSGGLFYPR